MLDVAFARRLVANLHDRAEALLDTRHQVINGDTAAARDVKDPSDGRPARRVRRAPVGGDYVVNEAEVPSLFAVTEDDRGLTAKQPCEELRDCRGVGGC